MTTDLQSADVQALPPAAEGQLAALLGASGVAPLDEIGWIRVTGEDRVRWLNGMVTNSIAQLAQREGCFNFVLNAQGRIQGDLTAWMQEDSILLETSRDQMEKLLTHLNHFIIMDDVELVDISDQRSGICLAGPQAAALLDQIGLPTTSLSAMHLETASWRGSPVVTLHAHSPLVARFELWAEAATIAAMREELIAAGAVNVSPEALEQLRILEGTPRYGIDIRDNERSHDLPQETGQTRALNFTKGCYLGQEIVERIHSRGAVHRIFSGFMLTGTLPAPGTFLEAEGKPVAELTSVASIQLGKFGSTGGSAPIQLALGIVRREALERKLTLTYSGGTAAPIALPYAFP
jgi:aminomethyltransferase